MYGFSNVKSSLGFRNKTNAHLFKKWMDFALIFCLVFLHLCMGELELQFYFTVLALPGFVRAMV
jgi:hypothetical protein